MDAIKRGNCRQQLAGFASTLHDVLDSCGLGDVVASLESTLVTSLNVGLIQTVGLLHNLALGDGQIWHKFATLKVDILSVIVIDFLIIDSSSLIDVLFLETVDCLIGIFLSAQKAVKVFNTIRRIQGNCAFRRNNRIYKLRIFYFLGLVIWLTVSFSLTLHLILFVVNIW